MLDKVDTIDTTEKEKAKTFKSNVYVQSFSLHNARSAIELKPKPMNSYSVGLMTSKYIDNFAENLEESEIFKQMIDN